MWPLCFLFNKLLKVEEKNQERSEGHGDSTSANYCQLDPLVSNGKYKDAELPSSSRLEVPHVHQLASWDCGLACVLMVLKASGITSCTLEDLAEICSTNSIWTVDLAYLLQNFCVEFSYFTITFGANPNYSIKEFYKEQLPEDLVRVDLLFRKAHESGIIIQISWYQRDFLFAIIGELYSHCVSRPGQAKQVLVGGSVCRWSSVEQF